MDKEISLYISDPDFLAGGSTRGSTRGRRGPKHSEFWARWGLWLAHQRLDHPLYQTVSYVYIMERGQRHWCHWGKAVLSSTTKFSLHLVEERLYRCHSELTLQREYSKYITNGVLNIRNSTHVVSCWITKIRYLKFTLKIQFVAGKFSQSCPSSPIMASLGWSLCTSQ